MVVEHIPEWVKVAVGGFACGVVFLLCVGVFQLYLILNALSGYTRRRP